MPQSEVDMVSARETPDGTSAAAADDTKPRWSVNYKTPDESGQERWLQHSREVTDDGLRRLQGDDWVHDLYWQPIDDPDGPWLGGVRKVD